MSTKDCCHLMFVMTLWDRFDFILTFTYREIGAQRPYVIFPGSPASRWESWNLNSRMLAVGFWPFVGSLICLQMLEFGVWRKAVKAADL